MNRTGKRPLKIVNEVELLKTRAIEISRRVKNKEDDSYVSTRCTEGHRDTFIGWCL